MKKYSLILLSFLLGGILLAGCSCQHQWTDATCTEPKTCSKCALTEGEALGHSWKDADCVTPKTCSRCAVTEGSPLDHRWEAATCTRPKTCRVCSATEGQPLEHTWVGETTLFSAPLCSVCGTEGEPLPGYFAQKDLVVNLLPKEAAEYTTSTFVRPDLDTTGLLTVSGMDIFEYDSTHRIKKGFEWRRVDISIHFSDNRSALYGANVAFARADYYQEQELTKANKQERFTVTYQDKEYSCLASYENPQLLEDGSSSLYRVTCCVQVPVGYDGVILAFHRGGLALEGLQLHEVEDENMLLLRLA